MKKLVFIALSICLNVACPALAPLGSKENPIKFAFVPGQDTVVLSKEGEILVRYLEEKTQLKLKLSIPFNFVAVVEAMGSKKVDMALLNSFGYLLAHERFGAQVRLIGRLNGRSEYWSQIVTAKSDIHRLADLQGKKFAYVDPASTSGYILPAGILKKKAILIKEKIFAGKHDSVITAVYQGKVDAGATFYSPPNNGEPQDARRLVRVQFPDVFEKVKIIELVGPIPSDPVVFRKAFPKEAEAKIIKALMDFGKTSEGAKTLKALYNITDYIPAEDILFDPLRQTIRELGLDSKDLLQ